jgi:hypothetical protein
MAYSGLVPMSPYTTPNATTQSEARYRPDLPCGEGEDITGL